MRWQTRLYRSIMLICIILFGVAILGCQSGQSPITPTEKNPVQPIHIHGDNNTINLIQKWKTDIWLEGPVSNKQDQENKADVTVPLLGP